MRFALAPLIFVVFLQCTGEKSSAAPGTDAGRGGSGHTGAGGAATANAGSSAGGGTAMNGGGATSPAPLDASVPDASPPRIGMPGCGFAAAAFCDTFEGPSKMHGRAGELDPAFWSVGRTAGQLSTTRAMGIGMAVVPECRPGMSTHVWPDGDTLICNPTADVASHHLLVAVAAQNYGQNSYRIRQPFDFAGRTGKIVFDATVNKLSPLHGWVSLAITEDPMAAPGYAIRGNDEGSIIPRNAIEVHFANFGDQTKISPRNVHVFTDYADTVYDPPQASTAPASKPGKLNHYEFLVSEEGIEVTLTPYSEDGVTFGAPEFDFKVKAKIPFSRGYVHLTVHDHAMIKYTQSDTSSEIVDATVAQVDNVGFDGPVIDGGREYEVPDALAPFNEPLGDPHNTDNAGVDVGYVVKDAAQDPKDVLHFSDVDTSNVTSATLAFSTWFDFNAGGALPPDQYAYRARFNGKSWHDRKLIPEELALVTKGPTTVDPTGTPVGDPKSQGRLALSLDVPLDDLVPGDNTVEFVTANMPTSYPPLVYNVDLFMKTK